MGKVELGQVVVTRGIDELMKNDSRFESFVYASLNRYAKCDWGDTCEEDRHTNDEAVKNGERILAVYKQPNTKNVIWIITEWNRGVTTILFLEEY